MDPEKYLILAYLEEDNVQRAYFRVKPTLTAEGDVHEEAEQKWPNDGCLRIVPDKNEQHTFKERMRSMGSWCMLDLTGYPSETNKIRSNKNFSPERGEVNQFILYSDAVKALPDSLFYEVLEGAPADFAALAEKAITPRFFIRNDDALHGPVLKTAPVQPDPAAACEAVLYQIAGLDGAAHVILCIPSENRITERPVRAGRAARNAEAKAAAPAEKKAEVPADTAPEAPEKKEADQTPAAAEEAPAASSAPSENKQAPADDAPLPIGQALNILDGNQTFEETLQGISQPLSADANLLHSAASAPEEPAAPAPVLTGTPLNRNTGMRASVPQPKNKLQEVVAAQCRVTRNDPPAEPLPADAKLKAIANPVEEACAALKAAWQTPAAHEQLTNCFLSLDGVKSKLDAAEHGSTRSTPLAAASRRYLQDLEAERLAALVELAQAKADTEEYRKACVAESNSRVRKEIEDLTASKAELTASLEEIRKQINLLTSTRDALQSDVDAIQHGTLPVSLAKLIAEGGLAAPVTSMPLRLNPVIGAELSLDDMLHRLELACKACGIPFERNRMIALLVLLAVSPRIGLTAAAPAATATLAANLSSALGWNSSFAHQTTTEQKCLVTPAPADGTPAILLTSLSMYTVIAGVTKVFLARNASQLTRNVAYEADPWPIFPAQQLPFVPADAIAPGAPVSAVSLKKLCAVHPADEQTVATALRPLMEQISILSGLSYQAMIRFASTCAGLMDGGLAAACDWAVLLWLIPSADRKNLAALNELLKEYPLSSAALNAKVW